MSKQTIQQKLANVETTLRRWYPRLTRATNMVVKLEKTRRRLQLQLRGLPTELPEADHLIEAKANLVQAVDDRLTQIIEGKPDTLDIPVFMARSLKQQVSEEERKKMPLSGREAEAFLKKQSAKVTARRAKKELRMRPK